MRNDMSWIKLLFLQCNIAFLLFFGIDFIYTKFVPSGYNNEKLYRIQNEKFHHTLAASFDGFGLWGDKQYRVCTDPNGFKSKCENKDISKKHFDIAFIGDSFTEAIGMTYEESFVGLFSEANPDKNIANLGVSYYSPTIYFKKISHLLDSGYSFKHIFVFVDISDIVDEASFIRDDFDNVKSNIISGRRQLSFFQWLKAMINENFHLSSIGYRFFRQLIMSEGPPAFDVFNVKTWTFDQSDPEIDLFKLIDKAVGEMSLLSKLLKEKNIKLSVGVYPWPAQLDEMARSNSDANLQVDIWSEFCTNRCENFINMFPRYFSLIKDSSVDEVYQTYFIQGDVHFNLEGNKLINDALLELVFSE